MAQFCDGISDCSGGADERYCDYNSCNRETQFRCRDGKCIANYKQCNGEQDCSGGEDESFCNIGTVCNWDQITCGLGTKECISYNHVCDGTPDCTNGNDELNCNCEASSYRYCDGSSQCYLNEQRCDGKIDCLDASDEANCNCDDGEFQCQFSGQCIPYWWMCDDVVDCYDASDEIGCYSRDYCPSDDFKCDGGRCLPQTDVCNGIQDCPMGEDEKNCYDCKAWVDMRQCVDEDFYNMWQGVYKGTITLAQLLINQCPKAQEIVDCIMNIAQRYEDDNTCKDFARQAQQIALSSAASFGPHCHIQVQGDTPMEDCGGKTATQISTITADCRDSAILDFSNVTNLCDSLAQFSTCMTDNQITHECAFAMNYITAIESMVIVPQDVIFGCNSTYLMFDGGHNDNTGELDGDKYQCYNLINQCTRHPVSTYAGHSQIPLNNVTTMMAELQLITTFFDTQEPDDYLKMKIYYREQICRLISDEDMLSTVLYECLDYGTTLYDICSDVDYTAWYNAQNQFSNMKDTISLCNSECDNLLDVHEARTECISNDEHGEGYLQHMIRNVSRSAWLLQPVQEQCDEIERMTNCAISASDSCPYIREVQLDMANLHATGWQGGYGPYCHISIDAPINQTGCENTAAISAAVTACNALSLYNPANTGQTCTNIEAYVNCMDDAVSSCDTLRSFYYSHYYHLQSLIQDMFQRGVSMFGRSVYELDPCDGDTLIWECLRPAFIYKFEEAGGVTGNTMATQIREAEIILDTVIDFSHDVFLQDVYDQIEYYTNLNSKDSIRNGICSWKEWPEFKSTLHCLDEAMNYPTYNESCGADYYYKSTQTASSTRSIFHSSSRKNAFWSPKSTKRSRRSISRQKRQDSPSTNTAASENFYEDTYDMSDYTYFYESYSYGGHGYYSYARMPKMFISEVVDTLCDPVCEKMEERAEEIIASAGGVDPDEVIDTMYTALQQSNTTLIEQSCREIGNLFNMGFDSIDSCGPMWDWFRDPAYCIQESISPYCHLNFTLQIPAEGCDYGERSGKLFGCLKNAEFDPQDTTQSCSAVKSFAECAWDAIHGCEYLMEFYGVFLLEKLKGLTAIFNCDWTLTIPGEENLVFNKEVFQCDETYMEMACAGSLAQGAMSAYASQGVPVTMYNIPVLIQSALVIVGDAVVNGQVENKELFCSLTSMINMTSMMGCEDHRRSCYDSGDMSRDGEELRICGKYDPERAYNPEYKEPHLYEHKSSSTGGYKEYLKIKIAAKKSVQVTPFRRFKQAMKKAFKKSPLTQRQSMNYDEAMDLATNIANDISAGDIDDLKDSVYDQGTIDDMKNTVYDNIDHIDQGTIDDLKNTVYNNIDDGDKSSDYGDGDYSDLQFQIGEESIFALMRNFICNPGCADVMGDIDRLGDYIMKFGQTSMYIRKYGKHKDVCDEYLYNLDQITGLLGGCSMYGITEEIDKAYSAAPICGRSLDGIPGAGGGGTSMVEANWTTLSMTLGVTFISLSLARLLESFI